MENLATIRVNGWNKLCRLVPQGIMREDYHVVLDHAFPLRNEITFSANAAFSRPPDVGTHRVVVYNAETWGGRKALEAWVQENYPYPDNPTQIEYLPIVRDIVATLPLHPTKVYGTRSTSIITALTIHHTVGVSTPANIAHYHIQTNKWPGIGYHYVIMSDGTIYQTNNLRTISFHAGSSNAPGDENSWSVGIALMGNFTDSPPPGIQQDAARGLVLYLKETLPNVAHVIRHKDMPGAQTACPGATSPQWFPYVAGVEDGSIDTGSDNLGRRGTDSDYYS